MRAALSNRPPSLISIPKVQFRGPYPPARGGARLHFNSKGPIQSPTSTHREAPAQLFQFQRSNSEAGYSAAGAAAQRFQFQRSNSERLRYLRACLRDRISIPKVQFRASLNLIVRTNPVHFNSKGPIQRSYRTAARSGPSEFQFQRSNSEQGLEDGADELQAFQFQRSNSEPDYNPLDAHVIRISIPKVQFRAIAPKLSAWN